MWLEPGETVGKNRQVGKCAQLSKAGHELGACTGSLRNLQPAHAEDSTGNLFLSTTQKFFLFLSQQPAVELRLESRAMAAPQEPHFMGLHPPLTALIGKAHSIKDFHFIFTTIFINNTLLPLLFFLKGKDKE